MKILLAYNGSPAAQAMFDDLANAGLPPQAEALLLSVHHPLDGAAETLRRHFPGWSITAEAAVGPAVETIVQRAKEWNADLITVGSRQRTTIERLTEGSVSARIANKAECSVRVCRPRPRGPGEPLHLLVGYDGQPGAEAAVRAVAARHWPPGVRVRLLTAVGFGDAPFAEHSTAEDYEAIHRVQSAAAQILSERGCLVTSEILEADPKLALAEHAARFEMDAIFIGNNNRQFLHRLMLGTVASAVVPGASCSVEIVR